MNMFDMISSFPTQIKDQYINLSSIDFDIKLYSNINHIVIAGMGGSAISGDIVANIVKDDIKVPITVVRDYSLPNWITRETLVILSSYSGNTEETLSIAKQAISATKMIVSITTGGELMNISKKNNIKYLLMPSGYQPRAALGYSLTTLLVLFNKLKLVNDNVVEMLINSVNQLEVFIKESCQKNQFAEKIANEISGGIVAVYGTEGSTNSIASRFQAQIAENSKWIAFCNNLPELNHNEIEGWNFTQFGDLKKSIVWLSDKDDHERVHRRIKVTSELLSDCSVNNIFLNCDGENYIIRQLKLIIIIDMISYYLAVISDVDPMPVDRISSLKEKML